MKNILRWILFIPVAIFLFLATSTLLKIVLEYFASMVGGRHIVASIGTWAVSGFMASLAFVRGGMAIAPSKNGFAKWALIITMLATSILFGTYGIMGAIAGPLPSMFDNLNEYWGNAIIGVALLGTSIHFATKHPGDILDEDTHVGSSYSGKKMARWMGVKKPENNSSN